MAPGPIGGCFICGGAHYQSDCPDAEFDEMAGHAGNAKGNDKGKGKGGKGKTKGDDARKTLSLGSGHAGQPKGGQKGEQKSGKGWEKRWWEGRPKGRTRC